MRGFTSLPRPLLLGLATLFAVATILYSAIWMYYISLGAQGPNRHRIAILEAYALDARHPRPGRERGGARGVAA